MGKTIQIFCLLMCVLNAGAQDATDTNTPSTALTASSTTEDVLAYADLIAKKIIAQHSGSTGLSGNLTKPYESQLNSVDHKTLIAALAQTKFRGGESNEEFLKWSLLYGVVQTVATPVDIPDLLDANTVGTIGVIRIRKWQNEPAVTAYLLDTLQQYEVQPPIDPSDNRPGQVLRTANENNDPKVAALLTDFMTKAANDTSTPLPILELLAGVAKGGNDKIYNLLPTLTTAMGSHEDPQGRTRDFIKGVILENPRAGLLANPTFHASAMAQLKAVPEDAKGTLSLAYLGDADAFATTVRTYVAAGNSASQTSRHGFEKTNKELLDSVLYSGPGDKLVALKDHYQDAVYNNGVWCLTMPGFTPPAGQQPAVPTPTPSSLITPTTNR